MPSFLGFAKKPKRWTRESSHGQFLSTASTPHRKNFRGCCNMPPETFLHERSDFKALVETVASSEKINDPALVEKDYWIMHAVFGLKQLGLTSSAAPGGRHMLSVYTRHYPPCQQTDSNYRRCRSPKWINPNVFAAPIRFHRSASRHFCCVSV